ncbi:MAG: class I SAM-dependent methyltransferase [Thermomicrobiales bacterium]
MTSEHLSWRVALAPGQSHGFYANPGWWDIRSTRREVDDIRELHHRLLLALPPVRPNAAVVDLGAGTGNFVSLLATYYPRVRFTLIDPNADGLDRAAEKLTAVHPDLDLSLVVQPIEPESETPLPGAPFQLATSTIALHDIVRPAAPDDSDGQAEHRRRHVALLRRVWSSLEPGGHLVYLDSMWPGFRVTQHLDALQTAGFAEVDVAFVEGRFLVCGGQRV